MTDSKLTFELQILDWTRAKPLAERIRRRVFIEEQNVPENLEWDKWDAFGVHALAIYQGVAIGTARLSSVGKIGRLAVIKNYRQQGVGSALLQALIRCAHERGIGKIYLHAQVEAQGFYQAHGFIAVGDIFDEAGIPHQLMHYQASPSAGAQYAKQ